MLVKWKCHFRRLDAASCAWLCSMRLSNQLSLITGGQFNFLKRKGTSGTSSPDRDGRMLADAFMLFNSLIKDSYSSPSLCNVYGSVYSSTFV